MNPLYRAAIHQLFLALDLPTPNDEESVLSLQLGPHLCHLAEHPTDHLLMFTRLKDKETLRPASRTCSARTLASRSWAATPKAANGCSGTASPCSCWTGPRSTINSNNWSPPPKSYAEPSRAKGADAAGSAFLEAPGLNSIDHAEPAGAPALEAAGCHCPGQFQLRQPMQRVRTEGSRGTGWQERDATSRYRRASGSLHCRRPRVLLLVPAVPISSSGR